MRKSFVQSMKRTVIAAVTAVVAISAVAVPTQAATYYNPYTLYKKAPKKVVNKFVQSNGTVERVKNIPGNPGRYQGNHSWVYSGALSTSVNRIKVNCKIQHVTYHELGHALAFMYWAERNDFSAKFPDETAQWNKIYRKERRKYNFENRGYVTATSSEYFAQAFATYCLHKKAMKWCATRQVDSKNI